MAVCKECEHYKVCLVHCSESVLRNRGICEHFKSGWISVKELLPEDPRFVLVYVKHPESSSFPAWQCIMTDMWLGDRWAENADEEVHEVTHWMLLPEPPEEDER